MFNISVNFTHLIIIGNGFDLNLNLKTSFTDFLESKYFKKLIEQENSICLALQQKFNLQNWIDVENELKIISQQFQKDFEGEQYV